MLLSVSYDDHLVAPAPWRRRTWTTLQQQQRIVQRLSAPSIGLRGLDQDREGESEG